MNRSGQKSSGLASDQGRCGELAERRVAVDSYDISRREHRQAEDRFIAWFRCE